MFSAIHSVVLVLAASAPAGLPQGSVGQAHIPKTLLSAGSISKRNQGGAVRFGPKGCVSTWLNDQARCMIKTECAEKDIDNYNFKFICVDESGEHVRHVFGKGSFDPEETFDTLVTCTSCTADTDDLLVSAKQSRVEGNKTADGPTSTNALLRQIVADVGELKVEMANATQNVERLNAAVFSSSTAAPPATPATTAAPAPEEAAEFLAHRGASALRAKGRVSRMNAIKARAKASKSHTHKIRRRHRSSEEDDAGQEDVQDLNGRADSTQDSAYTQEDRSQDDSQMQDDSQDQDDVRHQDDQQQQQEDDDADGRGQADAGDANSDDEQRDDEQDQNRDDDGSAENGHEQEDGDRDADDDGRREENVD